MNGPSDIKTLGSDMLLLEWPETISKDTFREILAYTQAIGSQLEGEVIECYPAYRSLGVCFDPETTSAGALRQKITMLHIGDHQIDTRTKWLLPVCYHQDVAVDLEAFAKAKNLTSAEVIQLHTSQVYTVHFFGFLPGFMYLGGLPSALHLPRKAVPSTNISKGAVAIGGGQTGIYPISSPGGWHAIGHCPVPLFDPSKTPPCAIQPGDEIQFEAVDMPILKMLELEIALGTYQPQKISVHG